MRVLKSLHDSFRTFLNKPARIDGRIWVSGVLLGFFLLLFTIFPFSNSWETAWHRLGVAGYRLPFLDTRILLAGFESTRLGYDAQIYNPSDPTGRRFANPHFWLALTPLGLDQSHAIVAGIFLAFLFYISTFKIMGRLNLSEALVYSLILCSPSVMWIVERGNIDIIVYFLQTISLMLITKSERLILRFLGYAIILMTAFLKLFPIFGLVILLRERKGTAALLGAMLLTPFAVYWLSNLEELRTISRNLNLSETWNSFGYKVIFINVANYFSSFNVTTELKAISKFSLALTVGVICCSIGLGLIWRMFQRFKGWVGHNYDLDKLCDSISVGPHIDSFRLGVGLYVGAFLMGTVYDYKLSFMIFCIPQMLEWIKGKNRVSVISSVALLGILGTLYLSSDKLSVLNLDEFINWFLLGFFAYSFALTLPEWFQCSIRRAAHKLQIALAFVAFACLAVLALYWSLVQDRNYRTLGYILLCYLLLWSVIFLAVGGSKTGESATRFILTTVSIGCTIGFLELLVVAKVIDFRVTFNTPVREPWRNPNSVLDSNLLHIPKPHLRWEWGGIEYRYDRHGFRNESDMDEADIVVIGDSIVEGWAVSASDLVTAHLAIETHRRVANLGISWYGPQQELEVLRRYGLRLHPDVCVWVFFEGNDLPDVQRYKHATKDWEAFSKDFHSFPQRSFTKNTALAVQRVADRICPPRDGMRDFQESQSGVFRQTDGNIICIYFVEPGLPLSEVDRGGLEQVRASLTEAYKLCRTIDARFLVVFSPTKFRVYKDFTDFDAGARPREWVINNLPNEIEKIVRENLADAEFIDLTSIFVEHARKGSLVYFPDWETHWSPEGHRVAASAISEALGRWKSKDEAARHP